MIDQNGIEYNRFTLCKEISLNTLRKNQLYYRHRDINLEFHSCCDFIYVHDFRTLYIPFYLDTTETEVANA